MREKVQEKIVASPVDVELPSKEDEFLNKLQQIINENIPNPDFDTEELSKEMLMSRTQLYRKLKAVTGFTPAVFVRMQRVKKAAEMLASSDVSISDVCFATGFNTISYFSKCFKDIMGVSPREYVKQQNDA